ncbi:MAG: HD domain-containing phosphohydrolase [Candidatus Omnitrophota bacterium]|jgi:HD-GYP domain-containing protein (c-di-GMP phosphodiesterase class II)|nr:HD domain-containing phosphohydrolase [Candidatus Omnitrophota bacterium]
MKLEKSRERERESYLQTVLALAQTVDEKDTYTHGHLQEVTYLGMQMAKELEDSKEIQVDINKEELEVALKLHDVGKVGIPDRILHKTGKLNPEEWNIMKQHCEIGVRIVEPIIRFKRVGEIIKYHQEKYDGSGYPMGLKGDDIPIESRIIAVVDAYHAMVSDRPYRKGMSQKAAIQELKDGIGKQFDPLIVWVFIKAWEKGKIKRPKK